MVEYSRVHPVLGELWFQD